MRWVTKTLHSSGPTPAPLSIFRTHYWALQSKSWPNPGQTANGGIISRPDTDISKNGSLANAAANIQQRLGRVWHGPPPSAGGRLFSEAD